MIYSQSWSALEQSIGAGSAWFLCVLYITLRSLSSFMTGCSWGGIYSNEFNQQVLSSSLKSQLFRRRTAAWACDLWLLNRRSGQSDTAHMVFIVTLICNVTATSTISLVTLAYFPIQEAVNVCVYVCLWFHMSIISWKGKSPFPIAVAYFKERGYFITSLQWFFCSFCNIIKVSICA